MTRLTDRIDEMIERLGGEYPEPIKDADCLGFPDPETAAISLGSLLGLKSEQALDLDRPLDEMLGSP